MYRTTALIDAPARVVAAAVLDTLCPGLAPGDEFLGFRLVEATASRVRAVAVVGAVRELSVDLAETAAGTLLTCTLAGRVRRRRALAVVEGIASRARARALELVGAPVVVGAAIVRGREVLAQQRGFPVEVAGRWELPGGRVEVGESDAEAVRRECCEELGVGVEVGGVIGPDVVVGEGRFLLRVYVAWIVSGEVVAREHLGVRWLSGGRLGEVEWLDADRVFLPLVRGVLSTSGSIV